jgi:hypothetical protein
VAGGDKAEVLKTLLQGRQPLHAYTTDQLRVANPFKVIRSHSHHLASFGKCLESWDGTNVVDAKGQGKA